MIYTAIHRTQTRTGQTIRFEPISQREMRAEGKPPAFDSEALTINGIAATARYFKENPGPVAGRLFKVNGHTFTDPDEAEQALKSYDTDGKEMKCST